MTPAAAIPVFIVSIAVMLGAAGLFADRLDHMGIRLGLPETLLGLLTALAADAPEITSAVTALVEHRRAEAVGVAIGASVFNLAAMLGLTAVIASRVRARHEALEVEAFVGLWFVAVALAVAAGGIGATVGIVLGALVGLPYVLLLAVGPGRVRSRFLERSFGERHRRERTIDSRREVLSIAAVLLLALCVIVAGGVGAVRSANDLADAWSVPQALVGVLVLGTLSALPNAWTGIRFGLAGRGSALMSETLNSNSINLVAGIGIPAALGSIGAFSGLDVFGLAWLLGMTGVAVVLFGRRGGGDRTAGFLLIALYAIFVTVQLTVR